MPVGGVSSKRGHGRACGSRHVCGQRSSPVPRQEVPPGALLQSDALPPAEHWGLQGPLSWERKREASYKGAPHTCRAAAEVAGARPGKAWNQLAGGRPSNAHQSDDKLKLRGLFSHPQHLSVKKTESDTAPPQAPLIFRGSDKLSSVSAEI